ncbi:methyltransferase [Mycobacterium tuberculosis]|nr:methyltransferase [Mycobacterium tuberculosis]
MQRSPARQQSRQLLTDTTQTRHQRRRTQPQHAGVEQPRHARAEIQHTRMQRAGVENTRTPTQQRRRSLIPATRHHRADIPKPRHPTRTGVEETRRRSTGRIPEPRHGGKVDEDVNGAERAVGHEVKGDFADGDCRNGDGAGATGQVDAQRVHRGDREAAREDVDGLAVAGNAGQQRDLVNGDDGGAERQVGQESRDGPLRRASTDDYLA